VLSGPGYGLEQPVDMVVSENNVFVANSDGNSLTELNASTGN